MHASRLCLPCAIVLPALLALVLAGCEREQPAPTDAGAIQTETGPWRTPAAFAEQNGLRLLSRPGAQRLLFRGSDFRLVLVADLDVALVNGRSMRIPRPPRIENGVVRIPPEAARLLPNEVQHLRHATVILDPGHGGIDTGAVAYGLREKDVVLDIARRTASRLREAGVPVKLTRSDDRTLSLDRRSDFANLHPEALFVSIHVNAASDRSVHGVETFVLADRVSEAYRVKQATRRYALSGSGGASATDPTHLASRLSRNARDRSLRFAQSVQRSLVAALAARDRRVKKKNLAVLRETYFGPAILVEVGFLTHRPTADALRTGSYRDRVAEALAAGICTFHRTNPAR